MDLSLEEEDFDSELLIWDNEEDDKQASAERHCNEEENNGNTGARLAGNIATNSSQTNEASTPLHCYRSQGIPSNFNLNVQQTQQTQQPSVASLNNTGNAMLNQPFLNTFISAMADQSSSNGQSAPCNVFNASNGLPLFFAAPGAMNQDNSPYYTAGQVTTKTQTGSGQQQAGIQSFPNYQVEPIFPPNFFLSGLPSWDPSQANPQPLQSQFKSQSSSANSYKNDNTCNSNAGFRAVKNELSSLPENDWDHVQVSKHIAMLQANQAMIKKNNPQVLPGAQNNDNEIPIVHQNQQMAEVQQAPAIHRAQHQAIAISDNESLAHSHGGSTFVTDLNSKVSPSNQTSQSKSQSKYNNITPKINSGQLPPFYLFDAPIELRHNFTQAQQAMNIPPLKDSNSFHYNLASKIKASNDLPFESSDDVDDVTSPDGNMVELLDARQKKNSKGSERNEREQQRAQKITELIDKLRMTIVQGGWKVEMKSKYQTLST